MVDPTSPAESRTTTCTNPILRRFRFTIRTLMTTIALLALVLPFAHRFEIWFRTPTPISSFKICSPCWIPPEREAVLFREIGEVEKAENLESAILKRDMASEFFQLGPDSQFQDMAKQFLAEADALQKKSGFLSNLPSGKPRYEPMFDDEIHLEPIPR